MVKTASVSPAAGPVGPAKVLKHNKDQLDQDHLLHPDECKLRKMYEFSTFCTYYNTENENQQFYGDFVHQRSVPYFKTKYDNLWEFLKKNGVSTVEPRLIGSVHHSSGANVHSIGALYYFVIEKQRSLGLRKSYEKKLKKALEDWIMKQKPDEYDPLCDYYLYGAAGRCHQYYMGKHFKPKPNSIFTGIWLSKTLFDDMKALRKK